MLLGSKEVVEWVHSTPLAASSIVSLASGAENGNFAVIEVRGTMFFTYGVFADKACQLVVEGSNSSAFAAADVDTLFTQSVAASVYTTPYLLAAPVGQNGIVTLTRPFIRLKLVETSATPHTKTHFYAKAWW